MTSLAAAAEFDPRGAVFEGSETFPDRHKSPVTLHLGSDGRAAAAIPDPGAIASDWIGTWTLEEGTLAVALEPVFGAADPLSLELVVKRSGRARGTLHRGAELEGTVLSLKATHPVRARGWTAIVPRLRETGGGAAGDVRGTLVFRRLDAPTGKPKKDRPVVLAVRAVAPDGLAGLPTEVSLAPGQVVCVEGGALPPLPLGAEAEERQFEVTGPKGFTPDRVALAAREEVIAGAGEAARGSPLPVHFVKALPAKKRAAEGTAVVAVPYFRDDADAGDPTRDARLVLRDAEPRRGGAGLGSVRVSVRTPVGTEVAFALVDLPPRAAVTVRPLDLLDAPGDLPGGEGQVVVTAADGSALPRGALAAAIVHGVRAGGEALSVAASAPAPLGAPGADVRLLLPRVPVAGSRVSVLNGGATAVVLALEARDVDGTVLDAGSVTVDPGETARLDPEGAGLDAGALADAEDGLVTLAVGGAAGFDGASLVAAGEEESAAGVLGFPVEAERIAAAGTTIAVEDAEESAGLDDGGADTELHVANGGAAELTVAVIPVTREGLVVGAAAGHPLVVAPGATARITVEQVLALLGSPLGPSDEFRGSLRLVAGAPGALQVLARLVRGGASGDAGSVLPVR